MSKFNFDLSFFKRVISKCEKTEKVTSLSQMVKEATEVFYDEYDYYPELGIFAPGVFTIMGDHLEYVKGNLVQAALPLGTVIVGKALCSVKCKLHTTSKQVEGLRKAVFPISHYKKNLKVFPEWVNYIKGVINMYPSPDIRGFDGVIHSNVPFGLGYGSSAALQVGFYTFLDAVSDHLKCEKEIKVHKKAEKGKLCVQAEAQLQSCEKKLGRWNNITSSLAETSHCVKIDCRSSESSIFDMRDLNILFLLTYPKFEIERKDRDLICWRKMELYVAAKLLGLEEIIDATGRHISALENMEDPTKDTVRDILREMGKSEECIEEFIEDLFYFPRIEVYPEDYYLGESFNLGENEVYGEYSQFDFDGGLKSYGPCVPMGSQEVPKWTPKPKPQPVSYIQERIAELCAQDDAPRTGLPQRICEEINCLGGLDNLSVDSEMTVCGKLLRRVRHIISENIRSLTMSDITSVLDYEELGSKLIQSHLSLKIDYDVSCPTLDGLVQLAIDADRVYGAKMTSGGGTLTLLHRSVVEKFIEKVIEKFGDSFQFYLVFPSSGARILDLGVKNNPKSSLSDVFLKRDELLKRAVESFEGTYKYRPTHGAFSPGVINFIGDHTDYNHGFSISMAINMLTVVVGAINGTSKIRVATTANVGEASQKAIFSVPEFEPFRPGKLKWAELVKGVIQNFQGSIKGFDCLIQSAIPCEAGIPTKTSLIVSLYTFLEVLSGEKTVDTAKKARHCMLAVQEFTKTVCGVGDFLVASRSRENFLVLNDSWTSGSTLIPFQDPSITVLLTLVDIEEKNCRALLYVRMEECYDVAKALGAKSLRCLSMKDLDELKFAKKKVSEASVLRATHVIMENERVLKAAEALKNNDFDTLGEIMIASHNSLRDKFEMVPPEIDRLVATAMEVDGVLGSKMPFTGSTSCILSLVKRWAADDLIEYLEKNSIFKLTFYVVDSYNACNELNVKECVDKLPSPQFVFEDIFPF